MDPFTRPCVAGPESDSEYKCAEPIPNGAGAAAQKAAGAIGYNAAASMLSPRKNERITRFEGWTELYSKPSSRTKKFKFAIYISKMRRN